MADVRPVIGMGALLEIISDKAELQKGAAMLDGKLLANLSRYENRLFADAAGSGATPYKVSLVFGEARSDVKGRCSCMAARSRPFCKHAAALLVAWSRVPEAFVTAESAPVAPGGTGTKKSVKKGKAETGELMKAGVAQVNTLVRELGLSGVASLGAERPDQVRALGEALRANGLRRLSARAVELAGLLDAAVARTGTFEAPAFTDLVADMLLTARKVEKHLGGDALEPRHVEELIGRTWTKKDRAPVTGLTLVEYAFSSRVTPDRFLIRESRFVDLVSGGHYSEKQILPATLKTVAPKKSHAGYVLQGAKGGQYPGFAPHRLDLEEWTGGSPVDREPLKRLLEVALPDVSAAMAAFQEHRKDVFAPDLLPVAVRVETLLASGSRSQFVDGAGRALFLPADASLEEPLSAALEGSRLLAVLGDVGLEAALPTLFPSAVVVETPEGLGLRALGRAEDAPVLSRRRGRVRPPVTPSALPRSGWSEAARAAGASRAAIALAEVRDELADAFASGLAAVGTRTVEPLVARLRELGLEKPGALLEALAQRPDPGERLDDFIKVYQVLGIALVRLSGAVQVEVSALESVPTHPSIHVQRPEVALSPGEAMVRRARGELTRYEAAAHAARYYASLGVDALMRDCYPTWSDGAASAFVARVVATRGEAALEAVKGALAEHHSRMVRRTALRTLGAMGGQQARRELDAMTRSGHDAGLRLFARETLEDVRAREAGEVAVAELMRVRREKVQPLAQAALSESTKEARAAAVDKLADHGAVAMPVLRQVLYGDPSREVRRDAAQALARMGDSEVIDRFVNMVQARSGNDDEAKTAVYALGMLGDVRGAEALLAAFADGWKPGVVAESMRTLGLALLQPALALAEARPEVLERQALRGLFETFPTVPLAKELLARVEASLDHPDLVDRAGVYLKLAAQNPAAGKQVAARLLELPAVSGDKTLVRLAKKVLG
ncbi:HEAT repeat domain-containing protein [Corallococcus praedator]|uniref:HEAT repeat domain-containing protein n=1 Tax=Corallococcus praedator TaxID=2316724 RepID=A0ABX9QRA8_9BACT|nr:MULTISPECIES: HEAT repeat domain-containing protein [Corallococcus]RKH36134.1 HEAT repeat domain-containing protein [Corallococcus sp. CA031C]RKI17029.1 HEAT repeat domain-containing protein [Corallococcus praedator]